MKGKQLLIWLAVTFQVAVVATMAISREWILANGEEYIFQTAPIDPRDIFRGDYVRLEYLFSHIPMHKVDDELLNQGVRKGQPVYLSLNVDSNGLAHGEQLSAEAPVGTPFLKGFARYHWPYRGYGHQPIEKRRMTNHGPVTAKYGIEQYYVEQGRGREIEEIRGSRNDFQRPMLVHAKVSSSGEAVISSYEWASIATKTEVVQQQEREGTVEQPGAVVVFTLKNSSAGTITLPLLAGNCSFALIPAQRAPDDAADFVEVRSECSMAERKNIRLEPNETYAINFDLNLPYWNVLYQDKPTPLAKLPWAYRYRILYRGENITGINGMILSRAFHGNGNID